VLDDLRLDRKARMSDYRFGWPMEATVKPDYLCQLNGSEPGETAQAEMELEGNEFLPHVTPSSLLDLFLDDSEHPRGLLLWPTSLPSQPRRACPGPFHGVFPAFALRRSSGYWTVSRKPWGQPD
jgi:hypothetical protein